MCSSSRNLRQPSRQASLRPGSLGIDANEMSAAEARVFARAAGRHVARPRRKDSPAPTSTTRGKPSHPSPETHSPPRFRASARARRVRRERAFSRFGTARVRTRPRDRPTAEKRKEERSRNDFLTVRRRRPRGGRDERDVSHAHAHVKFVFTTSLFYVKVLRAAATSRTAASTGAPSSRSTTTDSAPSP